MPISDRTRKILWARSGNRCAVCRHPLVAQATPDDPAALVADECHIVARSPGGPRAGSAGNTDSEDNLILLCRVDHKRVDDQPHYFTVERLRAIKLAHEAWVHATLSSQPPQHLPVRIRRRDTRPTSLHLATGGGDLLNLVLVADAYDFDNDDLKSEEEVQLVSEFLQTLHDYAEIGDDLEPGGQVEARFELGKMLEALTEGGFFVYVGSVNHVLEGGVAPPFPWSVATLRVKRAEDVLTAALELGQKEQNQPERVTAS
jgi:uncharacterized protein (DUF983 family)